MIQSILHLLRSAFKALDRVIKFTSTENASNEMKLNKLFDYAKS